MSKETDINKVIARPEQYRNQIVDSTDWLGTALQARGVTKAAWSALTSSLYPNVKPESILLVIDYCAARNIDVMLKPVHIVPMWDKASQSMRDIPMAGIGLYRIQASRSGDYAGADSPEFGPDITKKLGNVEITFPEWCKFTVKKVVGEHVVSFTAMEFWLENYATAGRNSIAPNSMWAKRPRGQLAKCAEAQALRKGWPEVGQDVTAEEMEGKDYIEAEYSNVDSGGFKPTATAIEAGLSEQQKSFVTTYLNHISISEDDFLKYVKANSISDISAKRYEGMIDYFDKQARLAGIQPLFVGDDGNFYIAAETPQVSM